MPQVIETRMDALCFLAIAMQSKDYQTILNALEIVRQSTFMQELEKNREK